MPRYKVRVSSEAAIEVAQAVHEAGIPTIGPAMARFVDAPGDDWTVNEHFTAVVDAADPGEASQRIRRVIGDKGEVVDRPELWGS